ncbi:MAG: hypothetical protein ACP5H7_00290 [Minisyncoccia bacterium]
MNNMPYNTSTIEKILTNFFNFFELIFEKISNIKPEDIKKFFEFLLSSELQEKIFWIKIIFVTVSAIFIFCIIFYMKNSSYLYVKYFEPLMAKITHTDSDISKRKKRWDKIKKMLASDDENQWKITFLDAQNFFINILSESGYPQKDYKEKLEAIKTEEKIDIEPLLKLYEIFQNILDNPNFKLEKQTFQEAIKIFEDVMVKINLI